MDGKEELLINDQEIIISNIDFCKNVMHNGEKELMFELGQLASKNGGDILEVGFGLHLSADSIQINKNVKSHTIIEIHPEIYEKALIWAKDKPNTNIILGDWYDIIPKLEIKFDGILHDTHTDGNIVKFLDTIKHICKKGTIVAFFQYPELDHRLSPVVIKLKEQDYNSLPYKNNMYFKYNNFSLKYTIFNGKDFYSEKTKNNYLI